MRQRSQAPLPWSANGRLLRSSPKEAHAALLLQTEDKTEGGQSDGESVETWKGQRCVCGLELWLR